MGFFTDAEYQEYLRQAPEFERQLVRSGIRLMKFWFSVIREEQQRRFRKRETDPLKQSKLSPVDTASLNKWDDYAAAREVMFAATDSSEAPWIVINSDGKKRARLMSRPTLSSPAAFPVSVPVPAKKRKNGTT
jgi:polyphosphate kinase 2 (PPK2 family)